MRALALLLALLAIAPAVVGILTDPGPRFEHPWDSRAHLTPPNPDIQAWPLRVAQGDPILPPRPRVSGVERVLVLLIEFTDVTHDPLRDATYFDGRFNDASAGARSLRAYYEEVSFGALTVNATVVPLWATSVFPMAHYGADSATGIDDVNGPVYGLVTEAVQAADPTTDFSLFDGDGDGTLDHIVVVHAGVGQEDHAEVTDTIWSHRWAVLDADPATPGSQRLRADGVQVYGYILVSESSPLGVVTHEFAHDLGLVDLYDTDGSSEGAGDWDLMAGGSWNGFPAGESPAHLSAWSRAALGWLVTSDVGGTLVAETIEAAETSGRAYRLSIGSPSGGEYFLVENRQPIGFDAGLPGSGLLIWHVDGSMPTNDVDAHRLLDLEEADEAATGDRPTDAEDPWRSSLTGFGPDTDPSSRAYSGAETGWRVRAISASGTNMTATIVRQILTDLSIAAIRVPEQVDFLAPGPPGRDLPVSVDVRNEGRLPAAAVNVTVRLYAGRLEDASLLDTRDRTIALLGPQAVATLDETFTIPATGRYLVRATLDTADEIPSNNDRVVHAWGNDVFFRDDTESGVGGWARDGAPDDPYRWTIVSDANPDGVSRSPSHAWRFGYVATTLPNPLPPSWHTLMSEPVTVTGGRAHLVFHHRYDLWGRTETPILINASETDHAYVEVRYDGGPWIQIAHYTTRDLAWRAVSLNLSANLSASTAIEVRFNASSDVMPDDGGWWIDDVMVLGLGLRHGAALLAPSRVSATVGGSGRLEFTVANVGDFEDTIVLGVVLPPGWDAIVSPDGTSRPLQGHAVLIAPDQGAAVAAAVLVPATAPLGTAFVNLTATSGGDPAEAATSTVLVALAAPSEPAPLDPAILALIAVLVLAVLLGALVLGRRRPRA